MFVPSTTLKAGTQRPVPRQGHGSKVQPYRHAYLYFALAFIVAMAGFWPSFFTRLGRTDAAHMIHGISATLWMTVPVAQAWLISRRKLVWHRRLGRASLLLAPVLVASGLHMVQIMLSKAFRNEPGLSEVLRLRFAFLDVSAMVFFVYLLIMAVRAIYRRDVRAHAQYMSCTVLIALEPALERLLLYWVPGVSDFGVALNLTLFIMETIVAALLYVEWRSGRLRSAYLMTLVFFVAVHLSLEPASGSVSFRSFARWFAAA